MLYSPTEMPTVFIISPDWKLRATVRAELREAGVEALGLETADEAAKEIVAGRLPSAVVLDGEVATAGLQNLARSIPMVVVASRSVLLPPLPSAAVVLYRPVSVKEVVAQVHLALHGHPA